MRALRGDGPSTSSRTERDWAPSQEMTALLPSPVGDAQGRPLELEKLSACSRGGKERTGQHPASGSAQSSVRPACSPGTGSPLLCKLS